MHFRRRDVLRGRSFEGSRVGWLQRATGANRAERRSEPKRDRESTRQALTHRQREARARQEKHRRRIAEASRRFNRRRVH
jgi:hypothetical protein